MVVFSLAALGCAPSAPAPKVPPSDVSPAASPLEREARAFVDDLTRHDWAAAAKRFSPEAAESASPARVESAWTRAEADAGPWESVEPTRADANHPRAVSMVAHFARRRRTLRVAFEVQGRVAGFWIRPFADDLEAHTRGLIDALARGDTASATRDFDARLRETVPVEKLEESWKSLLSSIGDFVEIENVRVQEETTVSVVLATCRFARGRFLVKVAYRRDQVSAFFLLPADA